MSGFVGGGRADRQAVRAVRPASRGCGLHYARLAKDDFVVERYTASGTHQGPLGDLQPTNRTATWTCINIFRIGCGRIVEVWSEVDAEGRRRQLILPLTTPGR